MQGSGGFYLFRHVSRLQARRGMFLKNIIIREHETEDKIEYALKPDLIITGTYASGKGVYYQNICIN